MTWWMDAASLGSLLFGGIVGNLTASLVWESGKWAAKPILDKIPDIASLVAQSVSQGNHDLLRALRRAECSVLVSLSDEALREEFDFRADRTLIAERLALRLREDESADLAALCRIRRAFAAMHGQLRTASVDDLDRLQGAAVADVPMLVKAGSECFKYTDVATMRERVVAEQLAALDRAVRGEPAAGGSIDADRGPLAPNGIPPALAERIRRHPKGWWDFLLHAFREELKDPANERARSAWQFDVLNQLPQLGATYDQFNARFAALDRELSRSWDELTSLRRQSEESTLIILQLLQQTVETTDGTRVAVEQLHQLAAHEFADLKTLILTVLEHRPDATAPVFSSPLIDYCRHLDTMLARMLPLGTDGRNTWSADVTLAQVYVDLDTTSLNEVVDDVAMPLSVVQAVATHKQLVLLGDAGSGKSTFVTHLARNLASRAARPDERRAAMSIGSGRGGSLIPVRVVLRDFAAWRDSSRAGRAADVRGFIRDVLREDDLARVWHDLEQALIDGRAILLFDGLDEIPEASARTRTRDGVADFLMQYPRARCVLTCRALAYEDEGIRLDRLPAFQIAPLDDAKIDGFIRAWFREMAAPGAAGEETDARVARLRRDIERPELKELASNPLLLTAIAILSSRGDHALEARPRLYRDAINLLLWQWDASKITAGDHTDSALHALIREAGWTVGDLERVLAQVAYEAQEGMSTRDDQIVADILEWTLVRRLRDSRGPGQHLDWASRVVNQLKERTGLLVQRAPDVLAFPHRTFQEYLAGRYLSNGRNFARNASRLLQDGHYWLRTVLLSVGHSVHVEGELDSPLFLLNRLCPDGEHRDERAWRNVWFAGEALAEFGVEKALADEYGSVVVRRVTQGLVALVEGNWLTPGERAKAAAVLGRIGDPRFRPDLWHLPADDWLGFVAIGPGRFTMGSDKNLDRDAFEHETPQHTVELPMFYIAKWPVTVAQFTAFVNDEANGGFSPLDPQCLRGVPNHPVTKITWAEALAYCKWLAEQLKRTDTIPPTLLAHLNGPRPWTITLPSEAEWEKAARGSAATVFPWGNDVARDRAHYGAPNAEKITAVGCFPSGRSPDGVEDLSGNVWEWTRSLWGPDREFPSFTYPYQPDYAGIEREDIHAAPEVRRVVRGGAGELSPRLIRSAYRFWLEPFQRGGNVGFRVALSPFSGALGS